MSFRSRNPRPYRHYEEVQSITVIAGDRHTGGTTVSTETLNAQDEAIWLQLSGFIQHALPEVRAVEANATKSDAELFPDLP